MQIELLLAAAQLSKEKIEEEKIFTQKVLPALESFKTFLETHEVFDLNRNKIIRRKIKLLKVYREELLKPFLFVICTN
ncbi:MAG: hypothetical protein ACR2FN_08825 [Chitinophagaceae bacterium]